MCDGRMVGGLSTSSMLLLFTDARTSPLVPLRGFGMPVNAIITTLDGWSKHHNNTTTGEVLPVVYPTHCLYVTWYTYSRLPASHFPSTTLSDPVS